MRILVIEDNKDILAVVADYLSRNHKVDCAQDGLTGLHLATTQEFDIIVLDVMLPGIDGFQLCKRLRQDGNINTPIIMLTAKDTLDDRLEGLRIGADDYLIKPFALSELEARITTILRRTKGQFKTQLKVEDLTFNLETLDVQRAGQHLKLNPTAMKLLQHLMQHSPAVIKRDALEEIIWGDELPDSDSLRSHVHQLRTIIDKPFDIPLIHTVHGIGYRIGIQNV